MTEDVDLARERRKQFMSAMRRQKAWMFPDMGAGSREDVDPQKALAEAERVSGLVKLEKPKLSDVALRTQAGRPPLANQEGVA